MLPLGDSYHALAKRLGIACNINTNVCFFPTARYVVATIYGVRDCIVDKPQYTGGVTDGSVDGMLVFAQ